MVGDWKVEGADYSVMGQSLKMDSTLSVSWEGQFLKLKTKQDFGSGLVYTDLTMLGYQAASKTYKSTAYTNFSADPRTEEGKLKDGVLTLTGKPWNVGMIILRPRRRCSSIPTPIMRRGS